MAAHETSPSLAVTGFIIRPVPSSRAHALLTSLLSGGVVTIALQQRSLFFPQWQLLSIGVALWVIAVCLSSSIVTRRIAAIGKSGNSLPGRTTRSRLFVEPDNAQSDGSLSRHAFSAWSMFARSLLCGASLSLCSHGLCGQRSAIAHLSTRSGESLTALLSVAAMLAPVVMLAAPWPKLHREHSAAVAMALLQISAFVSVIRPFAISAMDPWKHPHWTSHMSYVTVAREVASLLASSASAVCSCLVITGVTTLQQLGIDVAPEAVVFALLPLAGALLTDRARSVVLGLAAAACVIWAAAATHRRSLASRRIV